EPDSVLVRNGEVRVDVVGRADGKARAAIDGALYTLPDAVIEALSALPDGGTCRAGTFLPGSSRDLSTRTARTLARIGVVRPVRRRPVEVVGGKLALVPDQRDELRHRRAEPGAQVRLVDVHVRGQYPLAVGQFLYRRWLVGHERAHLLGVPGDEHQRVDRATAGGEEVHRTRVQRGDQPVQVVGVLVRGGL